MEVVKFNESDRYSPAERITLALARVQGAWDKKSKVLLSSESSLGNDKSSVESSSQLEKMIENILEKATTAFIGDGSMANSLLGKSVTLESSDRGLIVLYELSLTSDSGNFADWANSAIILNAISGGESYSDIRKNFNGKFENLAKKFGSVVVLLNKFFPNDDTNTDNPNFEAGEVLAHFDGLYGGSVENLRINKDKLEETLLAKMSVSIGQMSQANLVKLSEKLKIRTSDEMLNASLDSARSIFSSVMKSRIDTINEVLEGL